jgi:hypothetical protein
MIEKGATCTELCIDTEAIPASSNDGVNLVSPDGANLISPTEVDRKAALLF